jgi:hypothetical protein
MSWPIGLAGRSPASASTPMRCAICRTLSSQNL